MSTQRNPKDSMKSTWRTKSKDQWTISQWLIDFMNAHHYNLDQPVPKHAKEDPIPYMPQSSNFIWVMSYAVIPFVIHEAWLYFTGYKTLGSLAAFNLYFTAFNFTVVREAQVLRRLAHLYGFLDGDKHERDGVPDVGADKVASSLYKTTGSRIALAIFLTYNPSQSPIEVLSDWKWWAKLSLNIGLYGLVLDFFFYWYHRAMHDVDYLWKFHRTHHLTKHPNSLLSAYADHEQEFFDMVAVPLAACITLWAIGLPLGFYDWWICHQFIAFTEVWGHSGLRVHWSPPSTLNGLLRLMKVDGVVEDHDLHHRRGWRKSFNYGKQSRFWDGVFGTMTDRIESVDSQIDYVNTAQMPIF